MLPAASLALLGAFTLAAPPPADPAAVRARFDAVMQEQWKTVGVAPVAPADDIAFLRRVHLDLTGAVPSADEVTAFLKDRDPNKRARLVDELLASDEFAVYWGRVWAQQITGGKRPIRQDQYDGKVLADYLGDSLKADRSYKTVVTELITGEGVSDSSGPANFLLRYKAAAPDLAGAVFKNFLGVSLQCAQCHDHPFTQWKKDEFWGVAAYFGRLRLVESGDGDDNVTAVIETRRGDLKQPDPAGKPDENGNLPQKAVKPRIPGAAADAAVPPRRRAALAAWITDDANPYFAAHAVNRTWTQLFGAGLMAQVDALDKGGETTLIKAAKVLAGDFKANGYDLKRLLRIIVLSKVYQLSSGVNLADSKDPKAAETAAMQVQNFARFPVRSLSVDQLYNSVVKATGYRGDEPPPADPAAPPAPADPAAPPAPPPPPTEEQPMPDPDFNDKPVDMLGDRAQTVQRALVLLNGDYVQKATQAGAQGLLKGQDRKPTALDIERVFLATLSRKPTAEEGKAMLELLRAGEGAAGLEDVIWAVVNSDEFNSNH